MLYEVAVTQMPTKKESEEGIGEKVILPTVLICATDESSASGMAMANIDKEKINDRLKVYVRPFVDEG